MAKQKGASDDDILLKLNIEGREQLTGARSDAKALNEEMKNGGKQDLAAPVKSLKAQLREAKLEAEKLFTAGKQNTQEYANAAKAVTKLKNDIDELAHTFKALDPDNKFRVFANGAAAGAKAVQGYAGAMAFLGIDSEKATETIAKLQGIMAFADAIDSLGDLKDSFNDVLRLLGLNTSAAKSMGVAEVAAAEEANAATVSQIVTEEQLEAARLKLAEATAVSEAAFLVAREEGAVATEGLTAAEIAYSEASTLTVAAQRELLALRVAATGMTEEAIVAIDAQTVAMGELTVAEETATVGAFTFGAALKAIGIGLLISAIAYLISNFDKVKKAVTDLFPSLKNTGDLFNKLEQDVFGVGNVILQFLVAPIKAFVDLIRGDFKGALSDLAGGLDVVKNFQKGASDEAAKQAEAARLVRIQKEIDANELIIKERKALGQNTNALEIANQKLKIEVLDKNAKDYEKKRAEAQSELTVIINTETKRRADIEKAKLKADLDAIKQNNKDAAKIVQEGNTDARTIELKDVDFKYDAELKLLNKRKAANKNYNADYNNLVEARKIEEARINKKYDEAIAAQQKEVDQIYSDAYEKRAADINKQADELLKTATPKQKAVVEANRATLLTRNKDESLASSASTQASTKLTKAEDVNRPKDTDTPTEAVNKINNLAKAKTDAENAAFSLKMVQVSGQYDLEQEAKTAHEKAITDIEEEQAKARKEIAKVEAENRLKLFDAIAAGADTLSGLLGESTLAGKALAVASATISTYAAIAGQLQAFSKVPIPGYAIAQAIATGLVGLANVKKILSVKVPTTSNSVGSSGGAAAPVINSTVLTQDSTGSNNVVQAVQAPKEKQEPIEAFITNKNLNNQAKQQQYYNANSSY